MEQFAEQQRQQAEARRRRLEAEEEAARPPEELQAEAAHRAALEVEENAFKERFGIELAAFDDSLYRSDEYMQRNGESRKDGYWKYVSAGEDPPLDFTYGEFPLPLFSRLVDRACELGGISSDGARRSAVLADLGSGAGRLALWAAMTSTWGAVVGVEYLPTIASIASVKLADARRLHPHLLRTERIELLEGSWEDPSLQCWSEIDVAFAYTTAITADEQGVLVDLSAALARRLRRGALVVTTDYTLDASCFEVLERIEGCADCPCNHGIIQVHALSIQHMLPHMPVCKPFKHACMHSHTRRAHPRAHY